MLCLFKRDVVPTPERYVAGQQINRSPSKLLTRILVAVIRRQRAFSERHGIPGRLKTWIDVRS